jgi:hypothetical protein
LLKIIRLKGISPPQLQLSQLTKFAGLTNLNPVQFTKVNGKVKCGMVTGNKNGPTAPGTRVTGATEKPVVRASFTMLTVMCTKAIGRRIRPMGKESTPMQMVRGMWENGKMTSSMAVVLKPGPMALSTKGTTLRAKSMGLES